MSFKREGNDASLLGVLRKRRIKDLLTEDIPQDEAKLLSNGRFACIVCSHHPIFDTVNMLCIHRQGKKHKHYHDIHCSKKKELHNLIRKRQQEEIMKHGKTSVSMDILGKGSLQSSPYNPCAKKSRGKVSDRRPCLDLSDSHQSSLHHCTEGDCASSTRSSQYRSPITGLLLSEQKEESASTWKGICQHQITQGPVVHSKQLKDIFSQPSKSQSSHLHLKPYLSTSRKGCFQGGQEISSQSSQTMTNALTSADSTFTTLANLSDASSKPTWSKADSSMHSVPPTDGPFHSGAGAGRAAKDKKTSMPSQGKSGHPQRSKSHLSSQASNTDLTAKYRLLQGSGWKKDWDGKWIRDEDAEFDSDEEAPDLP